MYAQYLRIERKAGGVHATTRQFIRAAHSLLNPEMRYCHKRRPARHLWLRGMLAERETSQRMARSLK